MAVPVAPAAAKKHSLAVLELEYTEGGSSPWFNRKGRSIVASLSSGPVTAGLFRALALDGSMDMLVSYIDSESSSVSSVASLCYALLGLVLLVLFILLPLAAIVLRRYAAGVGFVSWIICDLVLLVFAGIQLICLWSLVSTWHGMNDALGEKLPLAYEWTFEILRNYTALTGQMLKEAKGPDEELDKRLATTTAGIKWLRGNLSNWESKFSGYSNLKFMLSGVISVVHMALLGFALATTVAAALISCGAWKMRTANLAKGRPSPLFVSLAAIVAAVLLCVHLAVALPLIARWLPVCVLTDTYLCSPYRDKSYAILDDGVSMVWPLADRPEPFCRLIPSTLLKKCTVKGQTPLTNLQACAKPKDAAKLMIIVPDDAVIQFQDQQKPQNPTAVDPAAGAAKKKPIGDCFYPYKMVSTDMVSVCPLFTDELLAHWTAMILAVLSGFVTTLAAAALAIIFMAVGKPKKKATRKLVRRKRIRSAKKKKNKRENKEKTPPPPSPAPTPPTEPCTPPQQTPSEHGPVNIVLAEPFPVQQVKRRRPRSKPVILMPSMPSPLTHAVIPVPVPVPMPFMSPLSPPARTDSQDAQRFSSATARMIATSHSEENRLSAVGYGTLTGYPQWACDMRGTSQEMARTMTQSGYSSVASPQRDCLSRTTPGCRHLAPPYILSHSPLCNRMRGVSPTAVEVMPPRHPLGGVRARTAGPPCNYAPRDKPQKL